MVFGLSNANAQNNNYYYYNGQKIPLTLNKQFLNITTETDFNTDALRKLGFTAINVHEDNSGNKPQKFIQLQFESMPDDNAYAKTVQALRAVKNVKHVAPYFERGDAKPIGTSNYFYVKLKNEGDYSTLKRTARKLDVEIVKQVPNMPLWYILSVEAQKPITSVQAANLIYETNKFADIDPAFVFNFKHSCTNDPQFGSLWGLENSTNPNIDISACDAWTVTEGQGVNVAILDQGIYKSHNDLAANIHSSSFDCNSGTSPSVYSGGSHGTHVGGTVAAVKDNNLQVVGVAPQSELMSVSHTLGLTPNVSAELASGMNWAWQNGADVINNSWGDQGGAFYGQLQSAILENAIMNAINLGRGGKGTLVVFAAGNYGGSGAVIDYPGNFHQDIVTVGSITSSGTRSAFSGYGGMLDVVAPGSNILSTIPTNGTSSMNGTSMAAPHATGTIALILSVNNCLSGAQVRDILETATKKIGGYTYSATPGRNNGVWNNQMGYGLIDAYLALKIAINTYGYGAGLDLYTKDSAADTGIEPNTVTTQLWRSPDIWVRQNADNGLTHQNPEYSSVGNPNTVYVRVRNRGCLTSTGTEKVRLYWTKAGTSVQWPTSWNGSTFGGGQLRGDEIGAVTIPPLAPNQEVILSVPWVVPNPADYNSITPNDKWHFCLLSRIEASGDPMTYPETASHAYNVKQNNNIAWKNISIVDYYADPGPVDPGPVEVEIGGAVVVENYSEEPQRVILQLLPDEENVEENEAIGNPSIFEQAEVRIKMNEALVEAWAAAGQEAEGIEMMDNGEGVIYGDFAQIVLELQPEQTGIMALRFNFEPGQEVEEARYVYHVVQRDAESEEVTGGETYIINTHNGSPDEAEEGNFIETMSPNPASDEVTVYYGLNNAEYAQLVFYGSYETNEVMTVEIDPGSNETSVNISDLANGYYTVALVVNGDIKDTKFLLKE
ncbi:hypothetical protein GCM10007424_24350 [Flavobacterium suaedae]|uniref:Peptidase S8/S53 domain-containing protein n=2 Tax=Flavobacterium suaedae TaxID=1767027 RepID=A0ABQ1K314_9FLAO|nr:hypothetical protein GCM10007424_24350 [Flavobacterium suaedae]